MYVARPASKCPSRPQNQRHYPVWMHFRCLLHRSAGSEAALLCRALPSHPASCTHAAGARMRVELAGHSQPKSSAHTELNSHGQQSIRRRKQCKPPPPPPLERPSGADASTHPRTEGAGTAQTGTEQGWRVPVEARWRAGGR